MQTSLTLCFLASTFFFGEAVRNRHSNAVEKEVVGQIAPENMGLVRDMERLSADENELHYSETRLFDEYAKLASTVGKCNSSFIGSHQ
jgi:hypothetical protein